MPTAPGGLIDKRYVRTGEHFTLTVGHSEVACHLRVNGQRMAAQLLTDGMVQLHDEHGPVSFPISAGEAGLYRDDRGYYTHEEP